MERYERLPDHKVNWGGLEEIIPTISRALNRCEVGKGGGEGKRCAMTHNRAANRRRRAFYVVILYAPNISVNKNPKIFLT